MNSSWRRRAVGTSPRRWLAPALLVGAFLVLFFVVVPWPSGLAEGEPGLTSLMKQRIREAQAEDRAFEIRRHWVPLGEIPEHLQRAVIIAEDHRFREHRGIDWKALAEEVEWTGGDSFSWRSAEDRRALRAAVAYVFEHRDRIRGRSTITQQLAKNLWWGTERSFLRKILEFPAARRLEKRLGKDRILELYLNVAEWGPGIFGAEAAAQTYFGRSAKDLSMDQAAALAATLPHPLTSNPDLAPRRMLRRKALILARMQGPPSAAPEPIPLPDLDLPAEPDAGTEQLPQPARPSDPEGLPEEGLPPMPPAPRDAP